MSGVRRFTQWGLWFGGALVLLAALLIGVDVLMRKFLARSIGGADELAGYALAIGTAWGLRRSPDRPRAYPHRLALRAVPAASCALPLDLAGLVLLHRLLRDGRLARLAASSCSPGPPARAASPRSQTPTVIPQVLWIAGLVLFVMVGLVLLLDALVGSRPGDLRGASPPDRHALGRGGGRGRDPATEGSPGQREGSG